MEHFTVESSGVDNYVLVNGMLTHVSVLSSITRN